LVQVGRCVIVRGDEGQTESYRGDHRSTSVRRWVQHPLIRCPLLGDFRQELLLCDNAILDEQLCPRVGLGKAGDDETLRVTGAAILPPQLIFVRLQVK
jgi:hypothetical protein